MINHVLLFAQTRVRNGDEVSKGSVVNSQKDCIKLRTSVALTMDVVLASPRYFFEARINILNSSYNLFCVILILHI